MRDPVLCADGHSYERVAIKAWLDEKGAVSPLTGEALRHMQLVPNFTLRSILRDMCSK